VTVPRKGGAKERKHGVQQGTVKLGRIQSREKECRKGERGGGGQKKVNQNRKQQRAQTSGGKWRPGARLKQGPQKRHKGGVYVKSTGRAKITLRKTPDQKGGRKHRRQIKTSNTLIEP